MAMTKGSPYSSKIEVGQSDDSGRFELVYREYDSYGRVHSTTTVSCTMPHDLEVSAPLERGWMIYPLHRVNRFPIPASMNFMIDSVTTKLEGGNDNE